MSRAKPNQNDLRRSIGYNMITFMSVFIFLPIIWFIHLFSNDPGLYWRWGISSAVLVLINVVFYYWEYPKDWLKNLFALIGIDLIILLLEYFWLLQSMG
ncbi:hypothetical protein Desaci_4349 [Desulfosporosinus acidiphilus SJ4]|uniref:Uncharacterized protein n=1 Tax=Desulfosporosinus acidiphilus (strain DSM 22704 / JCM 16185 / SJ4) TaxID=646529 RepID=I4DBM2_DESAJ|nr:hypothetical protein [Desulfosporosinus acidiphilus]AFM43196.1 hypothetical protein Desaci_4349 [Desulfosporosinus acidiphilus SJ4]